MAAVRNPLLLMREQVAGQTRPWESQARAASPQQVRRALGRIIARAGTPARRPQRRGTSPGREKGAVVKWAERFAVVRKAPPKAQSPPKRC